jgi:hypothetical protein
MTDYLQQKKQQLPSEMADYLYSMKGTEFNVAFSREYGIKRKDMPKVPRIVTEVFIGDLSLQDLSSRIKKDFRVDKSTADEMARDLAGYRFLVVDDHLEEDVPSFIEESGGDPADYVQAVQEQKDAIPKEKEFFKKELEEEGGAEETEKKKEQEEGENEEVASEEEEEGVDFDPQKEKEDSVELFKHSLISVLNSEEVPDDFLSEYNLVLAQYLSEENGREFRKKLENALLANQEELTSKEFYLEGKKASPTVGNWIKHFIKEQGSEEFDNLALSEFLSNSRNAAGLVEKEKRLVGKILTLYRNLKFFPNPFKDLPIDEWEIIPSSWKKVSAEESGREEERGTEKEKEAAGRREDKEEQGSENEKENIDSKGDKSGQAKDKEFVENKKRESKQREVKGEHSQRSHPETRLEKLKRIKENYEEGSLERKAIESEIRELEVRG